MLAIAQEPNHCEMCCKIRKLRKADLSVPDLVSQQEFLGALWIINELMW